MGSKRHDSSPDQAWAGAREAITGSIGGGLSIAAVWWCTSWTLRGDGRILVLGSMGAAAVLLFTTPHGRLSQPWNLLAGNLVSAFIGGHDITALGYAFIPRLVLPNVLAMLVIALIFNNTAALSGGMAGLEAAQKHGSGE